MRNFALIVAALAGAGALAWAGRSARAFDEPAGAEAPMKLGQERSSAGEDEVIKELVAIQLKLMGTEPTMRGQHFKGHGCVEAEFIVRDDIPQEYRLGLFKEAQNYKAKIRFSNGSSPDDTRPDVHGMAVKVLGVKGPRAMEGDGREEQDFLLVDNEVFPAPDAKTVLEILKSLDASRTRPEANKEFETKYPKTADRRKKSRKTISSPLVVRYWSTVPFKLGGRAVKYTAVPAADNGPGRSGASGKDYLREVMAERLSQGKPPVTFDLCIIPQMDPVKMPVENPTVRWDSTPIPVARIEIEPQTFDSPEHPEQLKECEGLVFDPWHALAEHRPLGGINRARKAVYPKSAEARHASRP